MGRNFLSDMSSDESTKSFSVCPTLGVHLGAVIKSILPAHIIWSFDTFRDLSDLVRTPNLWSPKSR